MTTWSTPTPAGLAEQDVYLVYRKPTSQHSSVTLLIPIQSHPRPMPEVPEDTVRIAQAAFTKGNTYMRMNNELGSFDADEQFVSQFSSWSQPAGDAAQLAFVTVMHFAKGLSDQQAVDIVRARND